MDPTAFTPLPGPEPAIGELLEAQGTLDSGSWAGIGTYGGNLSVDWVRITERTA